MREQVLIATFIILGSAVLLGSVLFVIHLRGETARAAPWPIPALHGLLGITGLACLIVVLRNPPIRTDLGTTSFGATAALLFAIAALAGGTILAQRLRKKGRPGALIGVHATLAVTAFVILAAYVFA
ncbi:MAG: hypothetical protein WCA56_03770 [Xanthobacteraceae bacterium]|jgi:hypothetical protein